MVEVSVEEWISCIGNGDAHEKASFYKGCFVKIDPRNCVTGHGGLFHDIVSVCESLSSFYSRRCEPRLDIFIGKDMASNANRLLLSISIMTEQDAIEGAGGFCYMQVLEVIFDGKFFGGKTETEEGMRKIITQNKDIRENVEELRRAFKEGINLHEGEKLLYDIINSEGVNSMRAMSKDGWSLLDVSIYPRYKCLTKSAKK